MPEQILMTKFGGRPFNLGQFAKEGEVGGGHPEAGLLFTDALFTGAHPTLPCTADPNPSVTPH